MTFDQSSNEVGTYVTWIEMPAEDKQIAVGWTELGAHSQMSMTFEKRRYRRVIACTTVCTGLAS